MNIRKRKLLKLKATEAAEAVEAAPIAPPTPVAEVKSAPVKGAAKPRTRKIKRVSKPKEE